MSAKDITDIDVTITEYWEKDGPAFLRDQNTYTSDYDWAEYCDKDSRQAYKILNSMTAILVERLMNKVK